MQHAELQAAPDRSVWGAVGSMAMCVAMLIASEFMPVSLLTPIASDLMQHKGWPVRQFLFQDCLLWSPAYSFP